MRLRKSGMGPIEIADKYSLDVSTVYKCLDEIAKANKVTRDSLLERPRGQRARYERQFKTIEPVDLTDFRDHFDTSIKEIDCVKSAMKKEIKRQEKIAEKIRMEEEEWAR